MGRTQTYRNLVTVGEVPMNAGSGTQVLVRFDMGFQVILSNVERHVEIVTTSSEIFFYDRPKINGMMTHSITRA